MERPRRALVLGSGGATGIAWTAGAVLGLAERGVPVDDAEVIIGTSAGAVVGAQLAQGLSPAEVYERASAPAPALGRVTPTVVARLLAAQLWPSRRHAVVWLGRWSLARARRAGALPEERWLGLFGGTGDGWPERLVVVVTSADTGRPGYVTARSGVGLARGVAASCAVPGVFPPVAFGGPGGLGGRRYFDGGLRSPANIDAAAGCDLVVALAPLTFSVRAHRRPDHQAAGMAPESRVLLLTPDAASLLAIGADPLDGMRSPRAAEAGRRQGREWADAVRDAWTAPS